MSTALHFLRLLDILSRPEASLQVSLRSYFMHRIKCAPSVARLVSTTLCTCLGRFAYTKPYEKCGPELSVFIFVLGERPGVQPHGRFLFSALCLPFSVLVKR